MIQFAAAYCDLKVFLLSREKHLLALCLLPVAKICFMATLFFLALLSQAESLPAESIINELEQKKNVQPDIQIIRIPYAKIENPTSVEFYYRQALLLALDKTRASDGDYELIYSNASYAVDRAKQLIVDGELVDLMWASHTAEREKFMRAIPVDLLQGLNNYRVLLINPQDQEKFSVIHTLDEFKQFTAGGGYGWTSSEILRANNINVMNSPQYDSLFKMLMAKRFDYISRGFHDVYGDFIFLKENGFTIETQKDLVLRYETPIMYCFFVNKNNEELANRIYRGLTIAEADGSFEALRSSTPFFVAAKNELNKIRREIILKSPVVDK